MADPFIGADQAQLMAGGGFGASMRLYLRHPGKLVKAIAMLVLGTGAAAIFGGELHRFIDLNLPACGALIGLTSMGVAEGILKAVDRFDFAGIIGGKKK